MVVASTWQLSAEQRQKKGPAAIARRCRLCELRAVDAGVDCGLDTPQVGLTRLRLLPARIQTARTVRRACLGRATRRMAHSRRQALAPAVVLQAGALQHAAWMRVIRLAMLVHMLACMLLVATPVGHLVVGPVRVSALKPFVAPTVLASLLLEALLRCGGAGVVDAVVPEMDAGSCKTLSCTLLGDA